MNILFIGDISGKIGRKTVKRILPKLKKAEKIDLVIANVENCAHGFGVTEKTLLELQKAGIDFMTTGDHALKREKQFFVYDKYPIIRPANYSQEAPGEGYKIIKAKDKNIVVINLIGRVFMKMDYDCPFHKINEILANLALQKIDIFAIIVDIHAECSSEKVSLNHYIDGKVSAVLGTHTHIMTADSEVTRKGTAYITDVGMTGFRDGSLGLEFKGIIKSYLTQIKETHVIPEKGRTIFNSVLIEIDDKSKKVKTIKPITKYTKI
jgi:2',3'-cyclic-nucleotide 2'-phosphodiesterase